MRIVQISTGYDISTNGGITNYVRNLSENLIKCGHDVFIIYSQDDGQQKKYTFKTIPYKPILRPFNRSADIYNNDVKKLEKLIQQIKPDIIHVHMMIDLPVDVLKMFKQNAKLVISLHDYSFFCKRITCIKKNGEICKNSQENYDCNYCIEKFETIHNRVRRKLYLFAKDLFYQNKLMVSNGHHERFLRCREHFEQADALIAVSNRVKEIYEQNGYTNQNFMVNHIGNYTAEDTFRTNFFNKKLLIKGEKIKFGFIGNFHKPKGTDIFLRLAAASNNEFHVYGEIGDKHFEEQIKSYNNIYYHGMYNHSELINILKNIEIGLVLPIWEDNAPQVVFEFLNANIPIIGTKMGGLPDFINKTNGVLFTPDESGIEEMIAFINSETIYDFYNGIINHFLGTKKPIQHALEIIELYKSLIYK